MTQIYEGLFLEDQKLIKSGKTRGFKFELVPPGKGWELKTAKTTICYSPRPNAVYFIPQRSTDIYVASEIFNPIYIKDSFNLTLLSRMENDENGHTFHKFTFTPHPRVDSVLINRVVNMPVIVPSLNRVIEIVKVTLLVLRRYNVPMDKRKMIVDNYIFALGFSNWKCLVQNPYNRLAETLKLIWFSPHANDESLKNRQIFPHYGKVLVRISPEGKIILDHAIGEEIKQHPIEQKEDGMLVCEGKQFYTLKQIVDSFSKG